MYKEDFNLPAKVTPRTFTPDLVGLIAWLETQEPLTEYEWMDCNACLIHDFITKAQLERQPLTMGSVFEHDGTFGGYYNGLLDYHIVAGSKPYTYGAALSRARALQAGRM